MEKRRFLIKDLPNGVIIWQGYNILGITGATLKEKYFNRYATKVEGNYHDYELVEEGGK